MNKESLSLLFFSRLIIDQFCQLDNKLLLAGHLSKMDF